MTNYNKINLYKENIKKFIQTQKQIIELDKISDIDYLIGTLFLTEICSTDLMVNQPYIIHFCILAIIIRSVEIFLTRNLYNGPNDQPT